LFPCYRKNIDILNIFYFFSFISQVVHALQPGRQTLSYYHCKYTESAVDDASPTKYNWVLITAVISSILLHIILNIRFKVYKHQIRNSVQVLQKSEQAKQSILFDTDNKTVVDFTKSSFTVLFSISTMIFLSVILNRINPSRIHEFPNNMIFFLYNFSIPSSATFALLLAYYLRNVIVFKFLLREIKLFLGI
jgi:hypothetical protein